jgi:hypothetical protein
LKLWKFSSITIYLSLDILVKKMLVQAFTFHDLGRPSRLVCGEADVEIRGFIPAISTSSPRQQMGKALVFLHFSLRSAYILAVERWLK